MKAWDITVESDEGYWSLRVRTDDEGDFTFELPSDVAVQLHRWVELSIEPWIQEREDARATYASRIDRESVQSELDAGVYDDEPHKRVWAESYVRGDDVAGYFGPLASRRAPR